MSTISVGSAGVSGAFGAVTAFAGVAGVAGADFGGAFGVLPLDFAGGAIGAGLPLFACCTCCSAYVGLGADFVHEKWNFVVFSAMFRGSPAGNFTKSPHVQQCVVPAVCWKPQFLHSHFAMKQSNANCVGCDPWCACRTLMCSTSLSLESVLGSRNAARDVLLEARRLVCQRGESEQAVSLNSRTQVHKPCATSSWAPCAACRQPSRA